MGHRLSKTPVNGCNASKEEQNDLDISSSNSNNQSNNPCVGNSTATSSRIPTINLQIQDTPTASTNVQFNTASEDLGSSIVNSATQTTTSAGTCPRQIIIKIQLAKMEPGQEGQEIVSAECSTDNSNTATTTSPTNNNCAQFLNFTFNSNVTCGDLTSTTPGDVLASTSQQRISNAVNGIDERTAGSLPRFVVNNNFTPNVVVAPVSSRHNIQENFNILMGPMTDLKLDEKRMSVASVVSSASSSGELMAGNANDVHDDQQATMESTSLATGSCQESRTNCGEDVEVDNEYCCQRKSKSNAFPSKWRFCKCTCRDAFKRIMDASSSKSSKKKERKENPPKTQQHSTEQGSLWSPLRTDSQQRGTNAAPALATVTRTTVGNATTTNGNGAHMSIWSPTVNDVIIPISSPQFVVVQCPPSSLVTLGRIDDNAIRLMATELVSNSNNAAASTARILTTPSEVPCPSATPMVTPANSSTATSSCVVTPNITGSMAGPVVHSQVDYIHCLVPDLERITKASFYWGKMDRYEAERLLEGKPEGTFLLRDSAQEEYLFSVTFRKYGRSLHARIEQSNHKFSFDCHDPCVFTATTVTGLLEHYKDPACVMFFEPMLTIPLHRNTTFSLQQLCRATIVSNTTYDGITELELPSRLKSYLKEYHYKQKLRVKPFDEPFYSCT